MKSLAPARSGNLFCRLVPRLPAALLALPFAVLLSGCAAQSPSASPDARQASPGAASPTAACTPAAGTPAPAPAQAPAAAPASQAATDEPPEPPRRAARAARTHDDAGPLPEVELSSQLMFQLLASEIAAQRGELASASSTYLSMARQTRDPRLARRAAELALAERSLERALPAARLWHELAPRSGLAAQTLEALLLSAGQLEEAEPLLRARLERARAEGELPETYAGLQRMLARASDKTAALALLERISGPDAAVAQARLALAAQAAAAGDGERAAREAAAAIELAPGDEEVAVAAAQHVAAAQDRPDGAIALLERFLAGQPDAIEARLAMARLLASAERIDEARAQFEIARKARPDDPTILFSLAQLAWQAKDSRAAEGYLRRYVELPASVQRNDSPAWLFLGQIAETGGRIDEAIERYGKVGRGDQFLPALSRRALLIARQGRVDEARKVLHDTPVSTNRERVQLIAVEAQVLREAGRFDEALDFLARSLERLPENPELLYDHAMAAERVDRLDLMEASLRKLISLRPDNAHAYNALGYTFADRNIRLEEAQQLIAKALELRPDDGHILDSMGWVLYRRGDLRGALDYLRKAWKASPEAEVATHLGEVLWASGERDEARRMWREARRLEPGSETLRKTLERFGVDL